MVSVEAARTAHADGIGRVCAASWRDAYADLLPDEYVEANLRTFYRPERLADEIEERRDEPGGWLVALAADENAKAASQTVVGVVRDDRPEAGVGEVSALYVRPDRQGEGVGTRLLERLTERQREAGVTDQSVSVFAGHDEAVDFYESKGFAADERSPATEVDGVDPNCEAIRFTQEIQKSE
ncbi:GNAT family N-acetyltransferase (plasmid) [Halorussus limi]|uniref:GNAT family N-acetyltransferase n=1 Tax=Halorussus limi TaxID=2938695 RepID=A0A8U0I1J9_9EURY|nr:GNAT family N-acetyltransferase [Halorussus limi]UPV76604.1 GNAT family N-acetyltransferase [Halorussus limi]